MVIRRLATILTFLVMGPVLGWPPSAPAQTAGLAAFSAVSEGIEALANSLKTLVDAWGRGLAVIEARQCRIQKQDLTNLSASLNVLVIGKTVLVDRLDRFLDEPRPDNWALVQASARGIQEDLDRLTGRMRQDAANFAAPPELSAAYRDILLSLEARKSLLMQGIDQLVEADRAPSPDEQARLAALTADLRGEVATLEDGIAAIGAAIERPCPAFG